MKLTWSWFLLLSHILILTVFSGHALMDVTWAKENWVGEWRLFTLRILKQKISQWMHTNNVRFTHHRASPSRSVTVHSAKKIRVIQGNQWKSVKNVCVDRKWSCRTLVSHFCNNASPVQWESNIQFKNLFGTVARLATSGCGEVRESIACMFVSTSIVHSDSTQVYSVTCSAPVLNQSPPKRYRSKSSRIDYPFH